MEHTEAQLKKLKDIRMTDAERTTLTKNVVAFMERTPVAASYQMQKVSFRTPSPYASRFSFANLVRSAAFIVVGMVVGGGALASASASSLPGDLLYPTKIHFNEEVVAAFQITPEAKIAYETARVEARITEVQTLVEENSMDETKEEAFTATVDTHIAMLDSHIAKLPEARRAEVKKDIEARLAIKVRNEKALVRAHILAKTDIKPRPPVESEKPDVEVSTSTAATSDTAVTPSGTITENTDATAPASTPATPDYSVIADRTILAAEAKLAIITKIRLENDAAQKKLNDRIVIIKHTIADAKDADDAGEYQESIALARRSITLSESTKLAIDRYLKAQMTTDTEVLFQL